MLFTAPSFTFVFLPMAVLFIVLFGKNRKRLSLSLICVAYYLLMNINDTLNLVWLPLLILYSYFSARLAAQIRFRLLGIILGALPLVWLVCLRHFAHEGILGFVYPVGVTMPALCSAGFIWDAVKKEETERDFSAVALYLTYFPLMILGPFVSYDSFRELTAETGERVTLGELSGGIRLFAIGFIKRIAVGAVLMDGYGKILEYSWENTNVAVILFMLVLVYFGVFFSISGYYDMSVGVSRILGVEIPEVKVNPLRVATVNEYCDALFGNVKAWSHRYVVEPIREMTGLRRYGFLTLISSCVCALVLVRPTPATLVLIFPLIAFAALSAGLKLDKSVRGGRVGLRYLFGVLMVLIMGAFWVVVTLDAGMLVPEYLGNITFKWAEYQTDLTLIAFSGVKYLVVAVIGLGTLLPRTEWAVSFYGRVSERLRRFCDYAGLVALLGTFLMTVIVFLPDARAYDYTLFEYTLI